METDSQAEYAGAATMMSHFSPNNIREPTVNVIKSNALIVQEEQRHSIGATDGDTSKRTTMYVLDSNRPVETFDFLSGSPIVHQAFGGRKL